MDLLTIVQTALQELGLPSPASVVGSQDLQIIQMLALVNRDGIEVFKSKDWTSLQGEQVINLETPITVTGDVTTGSTTITNVSSTTGIVSGAFSVSGTGMPQAQRVTGTVTATTVDCEMEATATDTGVTLTFARDTYNIVSNFDRYIPHTWWDRTNHWMLVGPQSPQLDQWQRWRQIGKKPTAFRLWPPPAATTVPAALVFEYVSNGWVEAVDGTTKNRF